MLRLLPFLIVALLALAACADPAEDTPEPDGDPAPDGDTEDAAEGAEPPDANLTEHCIEDFDATVDYFPDKAAFTVAETVEIRYEPSYKVLEVRPSFSDEPLSVVLLQCGAPAPDLDGALADAPVIEVPVTDAVTLTTANLAHFDALAAVDRLVGVGTTAFVSTPAVRAAIEDGTVEGYGTPEGPPDRERLIAAGPDVTVLDAFGDSVLDDLSALSAAGVPTLPNTDFEEPNPLGRAEWVKVTGALLNREADAAVVFDDIAAAYQATAELVDDVDERPLVLLDAPFEGTWFAPGGASITAQLVADAAGVYAFDDDGQTGSLAFDIETVLDRGGDADVWIGAGSVNEPLAALLAEDERFASIAAAADGEVWAGDAAVTEEGGNARFERGALRVDELLADFVAMLHPDRTTHEPIFYGRVGEAAP